MSVMIGIPVYNESKSISKIVSECCKFAPTVVVDDGCIDNTYKLAQKAGATIISHDKNMGYGKSISDLFFYAEKNNYSILVILDGDDQHNPLEIPNFLQALKTSDIVIGNRFMGIDTTPNYRKLGIKTINKFSGVGDSQSGFRAYNKKAIHVINGNIFETGMGASVEILKIAQNNNLKIDEIPCTIRYDEESHTQSSLSHGLDVLRALFWTIIWNKPLKSLLPLGLFFLVATIVAGIQTINLYVQFHTVVLSWALLMMSSIICTILIFNILTFIIVFKNKK